jgi:hypothetical protein
MDLNTIKKSHHKILDRIIDFQMKTDSPEFCSKIIGQSTFVEDDLTLNAAALLNGKKIIKTSAYQISIDTVIKACVAAFRGDIQTIQKLKASGLNLSNGDYDKSSPLYYAIRGN